MAQEANAKTLVLNHFMPGELPDGRWLRARRNFGGQVVVGQDPVQLGVGSARP